MLDALRQAAAALLGAAPDPVVRRVLRTLLAEEAEPEAETVKISAPVSGNGAMPRKLRRVVQPPPSTQTAQPATGWLVMRRQVRSAMRKRGLNEAQLAAELRFASPTLHKALGTKAPPSRPLLAAITGWLADGEAREAEAEPVGLVEPVLPFRRRGTSGNGNGANAHAIGHGA
jgi:hypothetical protein